MTAELARGQNHPLPRTRLQIRVSAGTPVVALAVLGDAEGRIAGAERVAHPGAPVLPGLEVSRQAAADHRLSADLDAVPEAVHRVDVLLALPGTDGSGPERFGAVAAPAVAVAALDGDVIASYSLTGLDAETAVIALELYRRQGAWKVRAVGQGYAGGLAALLADRGLPEAQALAGSIRDATARSPACSMPPLSPSVDGGGNGDGHGDGHGERVPQAAAPTSDSDRGGVAPQATDPVRPPAASTAGPGTEGGAGRLGARTGGSEGAGPSGPLSTPRATPGPEYPAPQTSGPEYPASQSSPHRGAPDTVESGTAPAPAPTAGRGGPIDYRHPRRRPTRPPTPPAVPPPSPGQPAPPVAGDAAGWSMDERLYNQVWGMFEDLARSVAAYRGAVDFADSRRERELDQALSDPRGRVGSRGDAARETARARHEQLVAQAKEALDRDVAQLAAEAQVVDPALPPAYARWDSPVWHGYRVPVETPMALRLGDLRLPEADHIRIPMLVRLPLERGLWIDSGRAPSLDGSFADSAELRGLALETAATLAARLLAVHPVGELTVHVIDAAGAGTRALAPLVRSGVPAAPPAVGARGVADVLTRLAQHVDLVQMAVRGGAADSLPPGFDISRQLLIVNDFPHGFDDRAVNQLRYLADEGPSSGVHLMVVADREDAVGHGPLLDPLWRTLLRLTPVADDHLADPWVGHAWIYEPSLVPPGSQVLQQVLGRIAAARG